MTISDMNFVVTQQRAEHIFPNGWIVIVHIEDDPASYRLTVNKSFNGKWNEMTGTTSYYALNEQDANVALAEIEARS